MGYLMKNSKKEETNHYGVVAILNFIFAFIWLFLIVITDDKFNNVMRSFLFVLNLGLAVQNLITYNIKEFKKQMIEEFMKELE